MIKDERQRTGKKIEYHAIPENLSPDQKRRAHRAIQQSRKNGVSPIVLDIVNSMIQQYQSDLDYLKDK